MRRRVELLMIASAVATALIATLPVEAQCDDPIDLGRGRINYYVPDSYNPDVPAPLVVALHGYGGSGAGQEAYLRYIPLAEEYGFLYAYPDGTVDQGGRRFWNATDACCNFFGSDVDDSEYLRDLVDTIKDRCNVDPRRVYFMGHSNGGFMSYRMACDHADTIAAIVSLAGAAFFDRNDCTPSEPVHVLQIHGTEDTVILYGGGNIGGIPYPGAVGSVERWAEYDGCELIGDDAYPPLDLDAGISGDETTVTKYITDCRPGGSAELWTIVGGRHVPDLSEHFSRFVIEWFLDHPKTGNCVRDPQWICDGDTDGDGQVNPVDSGLVQAAFGSTDEGDLCRFDIDCDGQINPVDSGIVQSLFGTCLEPREACP